MGPYFSAHLDLRWSPTEWQGRRDESSKEKHRTFMFYSHSKYRIDVSLYNSCFILNISPSTSQLTILEGSAFVCSCMYLFVLVFGFLHISPFSLLTCVYACAHTHARELVCVLNMSRFRQTTSRVWTEGEKRLWRTRRRGRSVGGGGGGECAYTCVCVIVRMRFRAVGGWSGKPRLKFDMFVLSPLVPLTRPHGAQRRKPERCTECEFVFMFVSEWAWKTATQAWGGGGVAKQIKTNRQMEINGQGNRKDMSKGKLIHSHSLFWKLQIQKAATCRHLEKKWMAEWNSDQHLHTTVNRIKKTKANSTKQQGFSVHSWFVHNTSSNIMTGQSDYPKHFHIGSLGSELQCCGSLCSLGEPFVPIKYNTDVLIPLLYMWFIRQVCCHCIQLRLYCRYSRISQAWKSRRTTRKFEFAQRVLLATIMPQNSWGASQISLCLQSRSERV